MKSKRLRKGVEDAMGGGVLELESERQRKIGKIEVYLKFGYSVGQIAEELDLPADEVAEIIELLKKEEHTLPEGEYCV